jgi:hypothetical protein
MTDSSLPFKIVMTPERYDAWVAAGCPPIDGGNCRIRAVSGVGPHGTKVVRGPKPRGPDDGDCAPARVSPPRPLGPPRLSGAAAVPAAAGQGG